MEKMQKTHQVSATSVVVSIYLVFVGIWLLASGRIRAEGFPKLVGRMVRRRYVGGFRDIRHDEKHCWVAPVPKELLSDKDGASRLVLFEDDRPLGPAHCGHDDIRRDGAGRYSHWGEQVYFSTSDNSDPTANNRHYHVREA